MERADIHAFELIYQHCRGTHPTRPCHRLGSAEFLSGRRSLDTLANTQREETDHPLLFFAVATLVAEARGVDKLLPILSPPPDGNRVAHRELRTGVRIFSEGTCGVSPSDAERVRLSSMVDTTHVHVTRCSPQSQMRRLDAAVGIQARPGRRVHTLPHDSFPYARQGRLGRMEPRGKRVHPRPDMTKR